MNSKKVVFSGVQPSGNLHIGNYLGAVAQWVKMQEEYSCIFCVVDYHAITVPQDPKKFKDKIIEIAKIYLAAGIDPKKSIIFQQSDIKEHTELSWILNCTAARMSDMGNMTQYKEKSGKVNITKEIVDDLYNQLHSDRFLASGRDTMINQENEIKYSLFETLEKYNKKVEENIGVGLFDYPVLMAADILLYDAEIVPVGDDQVQHVELTRDLAKRFNNNFGPTFKIPEAKILKQGARIMGLDDPTKKMSKSAKSEYNYIALTDDPEVAAKKIMKATTDSEGVVKYDVANKPGVSNLLVILSLLTDKKIDVLEKEFTGLGYGDFKKAVAEEVKAFLTKFQKKYYNIKNSEVLEILENGSKKLQKLATIKINDVKKKIGVI